MNKTAPLSAYSLLLATDVASAGLQWKSTPTGLTGPRLLPAGLVGATYRAVRRPMTRDQRKALALMGVDVDDLRSGVARTTITTSDDQVVTL